MMYGVEIWGCSRHLESIEQVQLRALRMFFGVGTLHPRASLLREVEALPVVWEAKMCCVKFWLKVLNSEMYEGRLLGKIARRAIECGKGIWVKNMAKCVGEFEWQGVGGDAIKSLTDAEIDDMLSSVAWRKVRSMLMKELEERPKLGMLKEIAALELESSCAVLKRKRDRRMMIKLRGGTTAFQEGGKEWRGRREHARNARVKKLKTSATGCYSPAWDHLR